MKISVKSDYAARAVLGLAQYYPSGQLQRIESLASAQGIPANYLVQILIDLKADGIVRSVRGKAGGYALAVPPAEITLGRVLRALHGTLFETPALTDNECPPELKQAWQAIGAAAEAAADSVNFQTLADECSERRKMYYI